MRLKRPFIIHRIEPAPQTATPKFEGNTAYQRALWAVNTEHETDYIPASRPIERKVKCRHTMQ